MTPCYRAAFTVRTLRAQVSYLFLRVSGGRDQESKTVKFVFIVYVGPSVVGAAPTAEDEAKLEELYLEALKKQEKVVKDMGFNMDDDDKREVEMMIRNQYCGFQAKLKCKGSPAAKMNGGRY